VGERERAALTAELKTKQSRRGDEAGIEVAFEGAAAPAARLYDMVLVAVGRSPNSG
jgi:pyruvate/2-oxoglutarate dehydrogenase complex dihydrolipoamide dehydrogenase (E3) component